MRFLTPILLFTCFGLGGYIYLTESGHSPEDDIAKALGLRLHGRRVLVDSGPPLRDESGALVELDPADDLGGFIRKAKGPVILPVSITERSIHLAELYGQRTAEQLRKELESLRSRFEAERVEAFDLEFSRGNFEVTDSASAAQAQAPLRLNGSPNLTELRPSTDPATHQQVTGRVVLKQTEHSELYELQDAIAWLDARIGN